MDLQETSGILGLSRTSWMIRPHTSHSFYISCPISTWEFNCGLTIWMTFKTTLERVLHSRWDNSNFKQKQINLELFNAQFRVSRPNFKGSFSISQAPWSSNHTTLKAASSFQSYTWTLLPLYRLGFTIERTSSSRPKMKWSFSNRMDCESNSTPLP
jgi:hypothetical protein